MTTQDKGQFAQLRVQLRAAELGWRVSVPTTDARYDLILDDGQDLWRVQVKYASEEPARSPGAINVGLRRWAGGAKRAVTRKYTAAEIDAVVVYIPQTDTLYWLPVALVHNKPAIVLRIAPAKCRTKTAHIAADYIW